MKFSIITPVYNDKDGIKTTLESLSALTFDQDAFEVIIVDNNSNDGTFEYANDLKQHVAGSISVIQEVEKKGSYAARNRGIAHAKGEYMIFIDCDMWVDSDFLTKVSQFVDTHEADYVGCNVQVVIRNNTFYEKFNAVAGFPNLKYIHKKQYAPTAALIVKRSVIDSVGMFNEKLISRGDREFGNRVFEAGYVLEYGEELRAYHPARNSFGSLKKKYIRIGRGKHQLSQINKKSKTRKLGQIAKTLLKPINPFKYHRLVKKNVNASFYEYLCFYIMQYYFSNFCVTYGRLYEMYGDTSKRKYV